MYHHIKYNEIEKLKNCYEELKIKNENSNEYTENELELLQIQINNLNKKYMKSVEKDSIHTQRYCQFMSQIDNIYTILESNEIVKMSELRDSVKDNRLIFVDTTKTHMMTIDYDIDVVFVTMVGGGGAGGIGTVKNLMYYSGGGGGGAAVCIKKPVCVKKGYVLKITVGKGGTLGDEDGSPSYIEIINCIGVSEILLVEGGKTGHPTLDEINNQNETVDGGCGGVSCLADSLSGADGEDGNITVPSQTVVNGGNGGNSIVYKGGNGGGNMYSKGGIGGNTVTLVGESGKFGSGGGGSAPRTVLDPETRLSGNGGDGMVLIEC